MSDKNIILHLHVPKAGGSTLTNWIYEQAKVTESKEPDSKWYHSGVLYYPSGYVLDSGEESITRSRAALSGRKDLRAVVGHFHFGIHDVLDLPPNYVTVLREPTERIVSLYSFQKLIEKEHGSHQGIKLPPGTSLKEFVSSPPYSEVDNGQTRRVAGVDKSVRSCPASALELAKENIERFFKVAGVLEMLDETMVMINQEFGWTKVSASWHRENENRSRPGLATIDDETLDFIRARTELDRNLYQFVKSRFRDAVSSSGESFQNQLSRFRADQECLRIETISNQS